MRVVGKRVERPLGPRWPSAHEVLRSVEMSRGIHYRYKKGVVRYRNQDEANAHMLEILTDAMAEKSLGLAANGKRIVRR